MPGRIPLLAVAALCLGGCKELKGDFSSTNFCTEAGGSEAVLALIRVDVAESGDDTFELSFSRVDEQTHKARSDGLVRSNPEAAIARGSCRLKATRFEGDQAKIQGSQICDLDGLDLVVDGGVVSVIDDELLLNIRGEIKTSTGAPYDYELVFPGGFPRGAEPIERKS